MKMLKHKNWLLQGLSKLLVALGVILTLFPAITSAKYINAGNLELKFKTSPVTYKDELEISTEAGKSFDQIFTIANFSPSEKQIMLYTADAEKYEDKFIAESYKDSSSDLGSWLTIPTKYLTLKAGESKDVTFKIEIPSNAGKGFHYGSIIARETISDSPTQIINKETGLRVSLKVEGDIIEKVSFNQKSPQLLTVKNEGTTDYKNEVFVTTRDAFSNLISQQKVKVEVKNNSETTLDVSKISGQANIFSYEITDLKNLRTIYKSNLNFQNFEFPIALIAILALSAFLLNKKYKFLKNKTFLHTTKITLALFAFLSGFYLMLKIPALSDLKAQLLPTQPLDSYSTTIKWGNIKKANISPTYRQKWQGKITVENAKVKLIEKLHFENTDTIEITDNVINFNLETGPDNDGIVVLIEPTSEAAPKFTYENSLKEHTVKTLINYTLNSTVYIHEQRHDLSISTTPGPEKLSSATNTSSTELITETEATAENIANTSTGSNEKLVEIFTELPASPEDLAGFVIASDYVEKIASENETSSVSAASELIAALEATPELIKEISATPELNFVFIPSEKVLLPPQSFSFRNRKITSQELGTFIFVQNKNTEWNSYVRITDFISDDGRNTIPASTVTIDPGSPILLTPENEVSIISSQSQRITDSNDPKKLFTIPEGSDQAIFILKPRITIEIPPTTPPGRYKAEITLTNL